MPETAPQPATPAPAPLEAPETPTPTPTPTTTATAADTAPTTATSKLSKNQQKKLARKKRYEETRPQWKALKKEKTKARKERKRAAAAAAAAAEGGPTKRKSPDSNDDEDAAGATKKKVKILPLQRVVEDITLLMDCGFDELMTEKEIVSMSSQLTRCYSANRSSQCQFKMHVSSLNKRLLARYEGILQDQHKKWKGMTFSREPYEISENLVYLTADSPNTITTLEHGKTYVIGGIVDRNRYKSLCLNKANEQGIAHARLPIGEYIKMASRQVLTTNQVVEIMLEWLQEKDWEKAFLKVIPQRKMPMLKKGEEGGQDEGGEEKEEGEGESGDGEAEQEEEEEEREAEYDEKTKPKQEQQEEEPEKMEVDASSPTAVQPPQP